MSAAEQSVPMQAFSSNLRARADELGLSQAEVARRLGMSERRYSNYVTGAREPDLAPLVRIAQVLATTTDQLLAGEGSSKPSKASALRSRLNSASQNLSAGVLEVVVTQVEAVAIRFGRS